MARSEVLSVDHDGHVATVWLDRAEKHNAMGMAFWAELPVIMGELSKDPGVRAVVIAPKGANFSVGLDLAALASEGLISGQGGSDRSTSPAGAALASLREIKRLQSSINTVAQCPKPVIAAIWGWCIGGGVDLAAACDIRIASFNAKLSVREAKVAIVADLGSLQRLPRIIGMGHLAELAYTGKDIDASRAKEIGLVNEVYPDPDSTYAAAKALAEEISANSPLAVQGTKAVLAAGDGKTIEEGLEFVATWNAAFLRSNDLTEAMAAFLQKRTASFTGE